MQAVGHAAAAALDAGVYWVYVGQHASIGRRRGPAPRALWLVGLALPTYLDGCVAVVARHGPHRAAKAADGHPRQRDACGASWAWWWHHWWTDEYYE